MTFERERSCRYDDKSLEELAALEYNARTEGDDSSLVEILTAKASLLEQQERYPESLEALEEAEEVSRRVHRDVYLSLADARERDLVSGMNEETLSCMIWRWNKLVGLYRKVGRLGREINFLHLLHRVYELLGLDSSRSEVLSRLVRIYRDRKEYKVALRMVEEMEQCCPPDLCARVEYLKATIYIELGEYEMAVQLLSKLCRDDDGGGDVACAASLADELYEEAAELLVRVLEHKGELVRALETVTRLDCRTGAARPSVVFRHANVLRKMGRIDEAIALYLRAEELYGERGEGEGAAMCLYGRAIALQQRGGYAEALELVDEAIGMLDKGGDPALLAFVVGAKAGILRDLGEYDQAVDLYEHALSLKRECGDRFGQAAILNDLAQVHRYRGDHERAMAYYRESLAIKEKRGDLLGQIITLDEMALLLKDVGEYEEAEEMIKRALLLAERASSSFYIAKLQLSKAHLLAFRGDAATAARMIEDILEDIELQGYLPLKQRALGTLFSIHVMQGDYAEAAALIEQIGRLAVSMGDKRSLGYARYQEAMLRMETGAYDEAVAAVVECIDIRTELMDPRGLIEAYRLKAELLARMGRISDAGMLLDAAEEMAKHYSFLPASIAIDLARAELVLLSETGIAAGELEALRERLSDLLTRANNISFRSGLVQAYDLLARMEYRWGDRQLALQFLCRAMVRMQECGRESTSRYVRAVELLRTLLGEMEREESSLSGESAAAVLDRMGGEGREAEGWLVRVTIPVSYSLEPELLVPFLLEVDAAVVPHVLARGGRILAHLGRCVVVWLGGGDALESELVRGTFMAALSGRELLVRMEREGICGAPAVIVDRVVIEG